jgi:hypothetical protein
LSHKKRIAKKPYYEKIGRYLWFNNQKNRKKNYKNIVGKILSNIYKRIIKKYD